MLVHKFYDSASYKKKNLVFSLTSSTYSYELWSPLGEWH